MANTEKKEKMVSVIIPVYNAEKYIGYCLNSVVSQTYRNIEIILVNDGSTDNSLKICQNYANIDSRVKVLDVKNGGVSKARNAGVAVAKGEYIQFVDSDDVIKPEMTEKMVQTMETYDKDIVICGFEMITLNKENKPEEMIPFSSEFIGEECVYTKEMFLEKLAYILWRSSLLECPWNKLYRRSIVHENNIKFPEDMSLGEDFSFIIDYFYHINGAVLIKDKLYYYMQMNQGALTRKYREDLFQNQLYLIQKFEKLLVDNIVVSKQEKVELAEYTVSKMIQCIRNLFNDNCTLGISEKKAQIAHIINYDYIRNAVKEANYIDAQYDWIRSFVRDSDVQAIYRKMEEKKQEELNAKNVEPNIYQEKQPAEAAPVVFMNLEENAAKAGRLNKLLVSFCGFLLRIHKSEVIEKTQYCLKYYGIQYTIKKIISKLQ